MDEDFKLTLAERLLLAEEQHRLLLFGAGSTGLVDLLRTTHDCLIVRDKDGLVMFWNRAAEQLYGWTLSEARGQMPETLLKTRFPKPIGDIESELYAKGQWIGELAHTSRDGRNVIVASRWSLQADAEGRYLGTLQ